MDDAVSTAVYAQAYDAWRADPSAWWERLAEGISWERRWERVFDPSVGPVRTLVQRCHAEHMLHCVDRHVLAGRGEQAALIWDSAMTGRVETFTYSQLQSRTAKMAGALAALGYSAATGW